MKNWVAEGVTSEVNDFNGHTMAKYLILKKGRSPWKKGQKLINVTIRLFQTLDYIINKWFLTWMFTFEFHMMGASLLVNKTHLAFVTEEIFLPTLRMLDVNVKMNFLLLFTSVITVRTFSVLFNLMFGPYVISQFVFWYSRKSTFFTNLQ